MYIYGAGKYGINALQILSKMGIAVEGFIQTNVEEKNKRCCNLPVISKADILKRKTEKMIYIAVSNRDIADSIKKELLAGGYPEEKILFCTGMVDDNKFIVNSYNKGKNVCCFCGKSDILFEPYGIKNDFFKNNKVIGGGYRENCYCPVCGSIDRERWVYNIIKNELKIFESKCRILHFAPEPHIKTVLKRNANIDYYPCDLYPKQNEHKVDIMNIPYKDNLFDFIICNHVLEHVKDDCKAIAEMKRVLKPEGKVIISFPICMEKATFEDWSIQTEEERLAVFGQEDHVRLYGYDYAKHLEDNGLKIQVFTPQNMLNDDEIEVKGYIANDIVMVCHSI